MNRENILSLLEPNKSAVLIGLGCYDGVWTMEVARKIGTNKVNGVDIAKAKNICSDIKFAQADLSHKFPFENNTADVVHSNQVIEHISNLDNFVSEIYRVLKPGGYAVVSTENGSSWHNIIAAILGWQIFSLTNISQVELGIGNPLAFYKHNDRGTDNPVFSPHRTIFNYRGLLEMFTVHGFKVEKILGAGYHPLPPIFGKYDARHAHFLTIKVRKGSYFRHSLSSTPSSPSKSSILSL